MMTRVTVELFRAPLDLDGALLTELASALSAQERARADALRAPRDRARLLADLGWRRRLLADRVGVPAAALTFHREESGRLRLADPGPRFSVARSDDVAWYAISADADVGIDVERHLAGPLESLARRLLTPRERALYDALPDAERREGLSRCWACKEAAGKALGTGLVFPLTGLEAWSADGGPVRADGLEVHELAAGEGRAAAVAIRVGTGESAALAAVGDLGAS